eukprot:GEMP01135970.1.p1 GENE.GEMP01135970.1~~GEMP01135970.1.p1  ORF type:complete len:117 (+),score=17.74 GEMP01135970.1:69-419(+)
MDDIIANMHSEALSGLLRGTEQIIVCVTAHIHASTPPPEYPPNKQLKTVYHGLCLNNRYEIRRLVGEGSFAEIWEAMDLKTETSVALKLLNKDLDKAVLQKQKKSLDDKNAVLLAT